MNAVNDSKSWKWIDAAPCGRWPQLVGAGALLLSCSGDPDGAYEVDTRTSAIENGSLRPASMNGGTVRVRINGPLGWMDCSGQVISRDAILTAAHCVYDTGVFIGGYQSPVTVLAQITHQEPDGTWQHLLGYLPLVSAHVPQNYVTLADANDNKKRRHDVAVLRRSGSWPHMTSSDVTGLARVVNGARPEWLYAYGHGSYGDTFCPPRGECEVYDDDQLRRGLLKNFTWYSSSGDYYYRMLKSDYGPEDPHVCRGDSGGPWKTLQWGGPSVSGVQFAVSSFGRGLGECQEDDAQGVQVAFHISWITERVQEGAGSCSNTTHTVAPMLDSWEMVDVSTKTCW